MRNLIAIVIATVFATGLVTLSTTSAAQEVADEGVWIDLRSRQEYRDGHIEGAINIPHGDIGHRINEYIDDKSLPVHLYGSTGVFAGLALEILMEMGFDYVINEGSYQAILEKQQE